MIIVMRPKAWSKLAPRSRRTGLQLRYWQRVSKQISVLRKTGQAVNDLSIATVCSDVHLAMTLRARRELARIANGTKCVTLEGEIHR